MDNYVVYKVTYSDGSTRLIAGNGIYPIMQKLLEEYKQYGNLCESVISIKEHGFIEVAK